MPEDDTSSSAASAPLSLSSDMLEDDDDDTSLREFMMEPPLMVGPHQLVIQHDEKPAVIIPSCPSRRCSRKSTTIIFFTIIITILLITYTQTTYLNETYEQIKFQIRFSIFVVRNIYNIVSVNRRKRAGLQNVVVPSRNISSSSSSALLSSIENSTNRSRPDPPLDLFQNSTRLIWAYWHSGASNLSPLCQISLQSWKAHHPNWQIIILSDDTYHHYVPSHHIPSTFDQLKVQFRSDIVRLSVLARYGGAYLDMTTLMFKSLDGIWESELRRVEEGEEVRNRIFVPTVLELGERPIEDEDDDASLLTAAMSTTATADHSSASQHSPSSTKNAAGLVTNSVILSPRPNNPILLEFLKRILQYSENPASTAQELKSRPELHRVLPYMTQNQHTLGILGKDGTLLYSAHLWIFTDLVLFDKEMEAGKYFVDLPAFRWTYDFVILPRTLARYDALGGASAAACDVTIESSSSSSSSSSCVVSQASSSSKSIQEQLQDERIHTWNMWHILRQALLRTIPWQEYDDPTLANYFLQDAVLFKVSSDDGSIRHQKSLEDFMSMDSTLGRLYRIAMGGTGMNATLEGARPFGYGAEEACSFEFDEC